MHRPFPDLPWVSTFPELNLRLYVEAEGRPGVWFLSLDAANPLAVWAARRYFYLPYYLADMAIDRDKDYISYSSRRRQDGAQFKAYYAPQGTVYESQQGSLEHWLTERYCLYAMAPDGSLIRNDVHHVPWPLQRAKAEIVNNTLLDVRGISVGGQAPLLHYAHRLDVVIWSAEKCFVPTLKTRAV